MVLMHPGASGKMPGPWRSAEPRSRSPVARSTAGGHSTPTSSSCACAGIYREWSNPGATQPGERDRQWPAAADASVRSHDVAVDLARGFVPGAVDVHRPLSIAIAQPHRATERSTRIGPPICRRVQFDPQPHSADKDRCRGSTERRYRRWRRSVA
jgi:hypothetical protein